MKNKKFRSNLITYGIVIAAFVIVQALQNAGRLSSLMTGMLVPICVYVVLAVSLNLVVGISGELSLGHAGFMCAGAFSGALFTNIVKENLTIGPLRLVLAMLIGSAVAALFGLAIGIPVLRLKGDYLAIVTLAFGEIIKNVMNIFFIGQDSNGFHFSTKDQFSLNMEPGGKVLLSGPMGITGTPKDATFLAGVILILVTLFVVLNLMDSRTGRAIMAIRDNRIAAESIGLNIMKHKLLAFTVSAALAGAAGSLYAHNLATLQAKKFDYNFSILALVFVVLGGIGNIRGSVIAAIVLTALPEMLRGLSNYRMLIYSVILIAMMLFTWAPRVLEWRERHFGRFLGKKIKEVE
ncbi:MAG: branched-chain amino acid ABC transporter permease [Blautia sp.]|nr:branched-chain amino acid ABC transporter permease [Blautia sp.]